MTVRKYQRISYAVTVFASGASVGGALWWLCLLMSNDTLPFTDSLLLLVILLPAYGLLSIIANIIPLLLFPRKWLRVLAPLVAALSFFTGSIILFWNWYLYQQFLSTSQRGIIIGEAALLCLTGLLSPFVRYRYGELHQKRSRVWCLVAALSLLPAVGAFNSSLPSISHSSPTNVKTIAEPTLNSRTYVFGIDGADWQILWPMHRMGKIGALSYFMTHGYRSYLHTYNPTSSPLIWTTIATGKTPFQHGIRDFGVYQVSPTGKYLSVVPKGGGMHKVAGFLAKLRVWRFTPGRSTNVYTKRIWDILSEKNVAVSVVNWPVTIPAKPMKGQLWGETDYFHYHNITPENVVYPAQLGEFFQAPQLRGEEPAEGSLDFDFMLAHTAARDTEKQWLQALYHDRKYPVPLTMLYTHCLDISQHLFWKFGMKKQGNELVIHPSKPDMAIQNQLQRIDGALTPFFESNTDDVPPTVLIVSDHGFRTLYAAEKWLNPQADRIQGVHDYKPPGIFIFSKAAHQPTKMAASNDLSVFHITPLLLALFHLPVARDMISNASLSPLQSLLPHAQIGLRIIDTYETSSNDATGAAQSSSEMPLQRADNAVEQKLKSLGYIE